MTTPDPGDDAPAALPNQRLVAVTLDASSIARSNRHAEHEREVAIYDLIDANSFALVGRSDGPYKLRLAIVDDRLAFDVADEADHPLVTHLLSLTPLKRIIKDYFIVCDSYYQAIRTAPPSHIQAIDMGRRGLHDEGSRLLCERLAGKITIDHDTARRLFTLVCALHWKG